MVWFVLASVEKDLLLTSPTGEQERWEVWRHITMVALFLYDNKTNDNGDEKERQKSNRFLLTKQQICTCIMPFCSFLCRRCTAATWKFLISHARFMESVNTTQKLSFSFSKLNTVLSDSTWENFTNICQMKWNWMGSMKFETFSGCCHPKILLPWQRDVTTSLFHSFLLTCPG